MSGENQPPSIRCVLFDECPDLLGIAAALPIDEERLEEVQINDAGIEGLPTAPACDEVPGSFPLDAQVRSLKWPSWRSLGRSLREAIGPETLGPPSSWNDRKYVPRTPCSSRILPPSANAEGGTSSKVKETYGTSEFNLKSRRAYRAIAKRRHLFWRRRVRG